MAIEGLMDGETFSLIQRHTKPVILVRCLAKRFHLVAKRFHFQQKYISISPKIIIAVRNNVQSYTNSFLVYSR